MSTLHTQICLGEELPKGVPSKSPYFGEGTDTIVFRKPGFWGIWHDVGHFQSDTFWQAFGGTWADFSWFVD